MSAFDSSEVIDYSLEKKNEKNVLLYTLTLFFEFETQLYDFIALIKYIKFVLKTLK